MFSKLQTDWIRFKSKTNRGAFLLKETLLSRSRPHQSEASVSPAEATSFRSKQPLRIVFSEHPGWQERIAEGFRRTPYAISFADLTTLDLSTYDLVVPLSVEAVLQVGAQTHLPSARLLPMPSEACVRLCDDKRLLNERLIELGFGRFIPAMLVDPQPPFIVKKRIANNSDDCYLVRSAHEQAVYADLIASPDFFCQELVVGQSEYASHVVMKAGRIVTEVTVEYLAQQGTYIKATEPFIADNITRSPCLDDMEQVLAAIGYEGLCCLNYKMVDGRMRLIEINPRFGGSLAPLFFAFVRHLRPTGVVPDRTLPLPISAA